MKFATLFAAAMLFCSVSHVSAQTSQSQGELKFDNVIMKGYSQIATPMAVTSEGNVVVTSTMINGQSLGSFVAMSSPKLPNTPTWKVDIKSGSIINAILADNEGGVYIGGDFNEKITLGGITLTGKKSENAEKTNYTDASYMGIDAKSAKMASDGSNLYLVASVNGFYSKAALQVNGEVKDEPSFKYAGGINAFYVASVNLSNNTSSAKVYDGKYGWVSGASSLVEPGVASLTVKGDDLYIGGSFFQTFPFDTNVKAIGNTDIFFVSLKKSDLSVQKALASGYDEKSAGNDNEEKFSGFAIDGTLLSVYGGVASRKDVYSPSTLSTPLNFTADMASATGLIAGSAEQYTTGAVLSADGKYTYTSLLNADQTSVSYQYTENTSNGVQQLVVDKADKDNAVYNLQGMKLRAPQKGLNIIGGKKVVIK